MTTISPRTSVSSVFSQAEAAETLADMQETVRILGVELLNDLSSSLGSTDSLGSVSACTEATQNKVFNENLKTVTKNLKEYVLQGQSEVEIQERDRVADFVMSTFMNDSDVLFINLQNITELPDCIKVLQSLKVLDLSGCSSLTKLPDVLDCFPVLLQLNLQGCRSLTSFPRSVMGARWFTDVFIQGTGILLANPTKSGVQSFKTT